MKFCLLGLKAWIGWCQPPGGAPVRWYHRLAAFATMPVFFLVNLLLLIRVRFGGPLRLDGSIPGGTVVRCQLPDVVQLYVFLFGIWEPDITAFIRRRLSPGDTFCDIGAHVGYYSLLASAWVGPSGNVIAVEASPTNFAMLEENLLRNGATNVRARNVAATEKPGTLSIHQGPAWNLGWSTTHVGRGLPVECQVPAIPVEEILTTDERSRLRVIKVDVEGTERELFAGLLSLLRESLPQAEVVLEVSPRWWPDPPMTIEQAMQPFVDAGYYLYIVDNDYGPWRYFWPHSVRPPRRVRAPIRSWVGQKDLVLSPIDREQL